MARLRQLTTLLPQPLRFGLRRIAFAGTAETCVLCGAGIRSFGAHGGGAEVLDRRRVVGGMRRENDRCRPAAAQSQFERGAASRQLDRTGRPRISQPSAVSQSATTRLELWVSV